MKRLLFLILCLLTLTGEVCGANTYYVDNTITDTNVASATPDFTSYDPTTFATTGGSASVYKTIADINAKAFSAGDIVLFRRGQTFSDADLKPRVGGITLGFFGDLSSPPPKLTGAMSYSLWLSVVDNITVKGLWFSGKQIYLGGTSIGNVFQYCLISDITGYAFNHSSSQSEIYNCVFLRNSSQVIRTSGTSPSCIVKNCIIINGCNSGSFAPTASGQISYGNNLIVGSKTPSRVAYTNCTDLGGNILHQLPLFRANKYPTPKMAFTVDDTGNLPFFESVTSALSAYGIKCTQFISAFNVLGSKDVARVQSLAEAGHEFGLHGGSHSSLSATEAFVVTTTNADATINVNRASKTLTLSTSTEGNTVTVNWSTTAKNITDLKIAVSGKGWTITNSTDISNVMRLSSLADTNGTVSIPHTMLLDISVPDYGYFYDEIVAAKEAFIAQYRITPATMAYPYGALSDAAEAYIKASRTLTAVRGTGVTTGATDRLSSMNIWRVWTTSGATHIKGDGTEASIRANSRDLYVQALINGSNIAILVHNATDMTVQQVTWMIDELYNLGVTFVTFKEMMDAIIADHTSTDGIIYTKTYSDNDDFHLSSGSPAINAGVDVGLTSDSEGKAVPYGAAPDIGAHEYYAAEEDLFANFSATPLTGMVPLTVNFTDQSTGLITAWLWDFGDGATGTDQNPVHIYQSPDVYSVKLTVSNGSESNTKEINNYIIVSAYYDLMVIKSGTGTGSVDSSPDGNSCGTNCESYAPGVIVELTATPDEDSIFSNWEGCDSSIENRCWVTMNSAKTVAAVFSRNAKPEVTVTALDAMAKEGIDDMGTVDTGTFRVTRTGINSSALSVYFVMSGTATNGVDYNTITSPVTIAAGQLFVDITLIPRTDTLTEKSENAVLTLTTKSAYDIGLPDSATVTVLDKLAKKKTVE